MPPQSDRLSPPDYMFGGMYIDGEWRSGQSGKAITFHNPWTEQVIGSIAGADACDVDVAYAAATTNQSVWASTLPGDRAEILLRVARLMEVRRTEIQGWLVREAGSTQAKAQTEWWAVHNSVHEAATLPSRVEGRILYGDYPAKENRIYRRPVGVVAVISPWNWPLHLSMRSVAPALALGNAVVLKPSADTPVTGGLLIARLFEEAGLPPGVLNVIVGASATIGDALVEHDAPRVISFTGSAEVGRRVGRLAVGARLLKRAMLELGGNAPLIVTEDVDLDQAVQVALAGKFLHGGQMCIAVNRIIVADAVHDRFVTGFVARCRCLKITDSDDPDTAFGPVINRRQLDRLTDLLASAQRNGARLRLGGVAKGLILPPQVFDQVTADMDIARLEIFGPIAPILRACNDNDAVQIANATDFGLSSAVLCRDEGRALEIAQRIEAGMTHINDIPAIDMPQMPFGGDKNSGMGRFGSQGMIDAFTTEHWISVQHRSGQHMP
jgi:aldehyde dehydrogenase (NAD+)